MTEGTRLANLVAALGLETVDRIGAATSEVTSLSPSAVSALIALDNYAADRPQGTLRVALDLSQPATARVLDRLERERLVCRRRGRASDGRELRVSVTPRGRELAARIGAARLEAIDELLGELPTGSHPALERAVETLLTAATRGRDDAQRICRRCAPDVCGHPESCPVTQAADRAVGR